MQVVASRHGLVAISSRTLGTSRTCLQPHLCCCKSIGGNQVTSRNLVGMSLLGHAFKTSVTLIGMRQQTVAEGPVM